MATNAKAEKAASKQKELPQTYATGRRKSSVARVWLRPGSGKCIVNGKELAAYFTRPVLRMVINQPFVAVEGIGGYDVLATVEGGGLSGQAGALRHGISRALNAYNSELHTTLRKGDYLTRYSREVERKKYGRASARRRFQFSKR